MRAGIAAEYQLLKVLYGDDTTGLVSLKTGELLAAVDYRWLSVPSAVPTVAVSDFDMQRLFGEEHCWSDVIQFLQENYNYERGALNGI